MPRDKIPDPEKTPRQPAEDTGRAAHSKIILGWREWIDFPDFDGLRIKAKIDTGARTSALHAANIEVIEDAGGAAVEFDVPRARKLGTGIVRCRAKLIERRRIRNSGGIDSFRYIIEANAGIGGIVVPIEISLTRRDRMQLSMLIGRTAIAGRFLVNPEKSFLLGK